MSEPLIVLRNVTKTYRTADGGFNRPRRRNLAIDARQFVAVVGASGSGKSTSCTLLAGIDRPTCGEVQGRGHRAAALSERALTAWRGRAVGIVFQFFQLLPTAHRARERHAADGFLRCLAAARAPRPVRSVS